MLVHTGENVKGFGVSCLLAFLAHFTKFCVDTQESTNSPLKPVVFLRILFCLISLNLIDVFVYKIHSLISFMNARGGWWRWLVLVYFRVFFWKCPNCSLRPSFTDMANNFKSPKASKHASCG